MKPTFHILLVEDSRADVKIIERALAEGNVSHRLTVLRSYSHDNNDHFQSQAYALSGRKVGPTQINTEPNVGSVVSYLHGPRHGRHVGAVRRRRR